MQRDREAQRHREREEGRWGSRGRKERERSRERGVEEEPLHMLWESKVIIAIALC